MNFLIQPLIEEICDELTEHDEETLKFYWQAVSVVIEWVAAGETSRITPELAPFICTLLDLPIPENVEDVTERLALTR